MFDMERWARRRHKPGTLPAIIRKMYASEISLESAFKAVQANYIAEALLQHDGNVGRAASALRVTRQELYRMRRACGVLPKSRKGSAR